MNRFTLIASLTALWIAALSLPATAQDVTADVKTPCAVANAMFFQLRSPPSIIVEKVDDTALDTAPPTTIAATGCSNADPASDPAPPATWPTTMFTAVTAAICPHDAPFSYITAAFMPASMIVAATQPAPAV